MTLLNSIKYALTVLVQVCTTKRNASRQLGAGHKAVEKHITRCYILLSPGKGQIREH